MLNGTVFMEGNDGPALGVHILFVRFIDPTASRHNRLKVVLDDTDFDDPGCIDLKVVAGKPRMTKGKFLVAKREFCGTASGGAQDRFDPHVTTKVRVFRRKCG